VASCRFGNLKYLSRGQIGQPRITYCAGVGLTDCQPWPRPLTLISDKPRHASRGVMIQREPSPVFGNPCSRGNDDVSRPSASDSESSNGMEYNEFSSYIQIKRDSSITDALEWWKGSQSMNPKLSKMARDVSAVPAMGAGVEREFSISGRVVTTQRNRLSPTTIRDKCNTNDGSQGMEW